AATLAGREERFAIVTVVRREPPSSARVGDVALVTERGEYHGWTGGGCTRSSVLLEAMRAIADGEPRLLSLSPEPEGGRRPGVVFLPMTCDSGGTVEIYVEPVLPAARLLLFGSSPAVRVLARIAHAVGYRVDVIDPDADEGAFPDAKVQRSGAAAAVQTENVPVREAVDPVCGMSVKVAGARHTAEALGATYYFCCAGCRTKFLADTAHYLAAGAGARGS